MFVFDVAAKSEDVKKNATIIKNVAFTAGAMFTYFALLRITPTILKQVSPAILRHRQDLPVAGFEGDIVRAVQQHEAVIVVGETGSGKTTQVPQFLLNGLVCKHRPVRVVVTQPRRVAAITVAERVAEEMGARVPVPRDQVTAGGMQGWYPVGYRVRFGDATRRSTQCVFATDGMLLREAQMDPTLSSYDVVVLDEAHERGLNTDVLFAVVKRAMGTRSGTGKPLKVVVMSATLDVEKFQGYFKAHAITVPGRQHPVALHYLSTPVAEPVDAAVTAVLQLHTAASCEALGASVKGGWEGLQGQLRPPLLPPPSTGALGDVLVFLSGRDEIETVARQLEERWAAVEAGWVTMVAGAVAEAEAPPGALPPPHADALNALKAALPQLQVVQLYAALSPARQKAAFAPPPPGTRKVILSTNIAETSITIPGIRTVIDTGYVKVRTHRPGAVADTLLPEPVSQAQAAQRTGRAGREAPGQCYRLYSQKAWASLDPQPVPEVLRVALASTLLSLGVMGESVKTLAAFPWLDPPTRAGVSSALGQLVQLGALAPGSATAAGGGDGVVTPLGRSMGALPLPPLLASLVLSAGRLGCAVEAVTLAALLTLDGPMWTAPAAAGTGEAAVVASKRKRRKFHAGEGDHITMLNAWAGFERMVREAGGLAPAPPVGDLALPSLSAGKWKAVGEWCAAHSLQFRALRRASEVRSQLAGVVLQQELLGASPSLPFSPAWATAVAGRSLYNDSEALRRALVASSFMQVAFLAPGAVGRGTAGRTRPQYSTAVGRREAWVHPGSVLFGAQPHPPTVVYSELVFTRKTYMRCVSAVEASWLPEEAGQAFRVRGSGVQAAMH